MVDVLNEIQQVIILAAGRSRRMESLCNKEPKCLLPYKGERVLERLVRQLKACGVKKIVITVGYRADLMRKIFKDVDGVILVENKMYEEDINIYSLSLALKKIDGPFALFEADTIMDDAMVKYVVGADFDGKSVWFTRGKFQPGQYGGVLRSDKYGKVTDVRLVASYQEKYKTYQKLTGVMRVGKDEAELFKALVHKYARTTIKQYFLNAWIENIKLLPSYEADITPFEFFTFNKPEEYYQVQSKEIGVITAAPEVQMVSVDGLRHIEGWDEERAKRLTEKIRHEGVWNVPVIVDKKDGLVLDGQHRLETAKLLGLKKIPALLVAYEDIMVWTLRKEEKVSHALVRRRVLHEGTLYPYKTVKHKFPFMVPGNLGISLEALGA